MPTNVENLKIWFEKLPLTEQEKILEFLYDKSLVRREKFVGPIFLGIGKGLFSGPAPTTEIPESCPQCKRPY